VIAAVSALSIRGAAYIAGSLLVGMIAREYARAYVATRLNDPTPRLWGRLTLNPRSWFDPFGSGLVPGLIIVLWAAASGLYPPPVAYGKPAPVDSAYLRRPTRDQLLIGFAGPATNVVLGVVAGLAVRLITSPGAFTLLTILIVFEFTQFCLAIFHLLPIPGLDGARLVGLALPPDAARVYRDADKYLPLFVLLAMFVLAGVINGIVYALVDVLCQAASGVTCSPR
jgi:Zn-dependent protease